MPSTLLHQPKVVICSRTQNTGFFIFRRPIPETLLVTNMKWKNSPSPCKTFGVSRVLIQCGKASIHCKFLQAGSSRPRGSCMRK